MKKALVLILALVMVAMSTCAFAETLVVTPGRASGCSVEMFKMYFAMMESQAGYSFVWEDAVTNDGTYDLYKATSDDGLMSICIYAQGGYVVYAEGIGSITANASDSAAAQKFGEWFGAALGGMVFGFYIGENGTASVDNSLTNKFTNDLMPMMTVMTTGLSSEAQLKNGVAGTSTVLGYPTGLEISGSASGSTITLNMRIVVTSVDGQLSK